MIVSDLKNVMNFAHYRIQASRVNARTRLVDLRRSYLSVDPEHSRVVWRQNSESSFGTSFPARAAIVVTLGLALFLGIGIMDRRAQSCERQRLPFSVARVCIAIRRL